MSVLDRAYEILTWLPENTTLCIHPVGKPLTAGTTDPGSDRKSRGFPDDKNRLRDRCTKPLELKGNRLVRSEGIRNQMDLQSSTSVLSVVPPHRYRVLIVDDHPIVRQGLKRMLEIEPDLDVCGDVATEAQARRAIRELQPDVAIVDLALQEGDGLELVRDVSAHHPELPMLVLSMHDEAIYAERLIADGAAGYIMKQAAADQLLTALRAVLRGERYVSEQLAGCMRGRQDRGGSANASQDPVHRLSNRELQVLNLVGRGVSSRDIAADLGLSVKTVESHRQSVKRKLSLETNSQLLQYAINWFASAARRTGSLT